MIPADGEITDAAYLSSSLLVDYPWLRLAPPIIAIAMAIIFGDVVFALLAATFIGCALLFPTAPGDCISGFCDLLVGQVADGDNASVILFTVLLGAMICLMNDSGGTQALIGRLTRYAQTRRKGMILTWVSGLLVFFDDYANTMLIGGATRSLCDRLKISRAKLAFLLDATAAPVAGLLLSTWTAFEIDQVARGLTAAGLESSASEVFLATIPYRIYPILAIVAVGAFAISGRDFGPMLKAESEMAGDKSGSEERLRAASWLGYAIIPVLVLLAVVVAGLVRYGVEMDSYRWLLYASLAASLTAAALPVLRRSMKLKDASESFTKGITSMIPAITVLVLAWAVGDICGNTNLDTANYIKDLVGDKIAPAYLPAIAFVVAGAIAVSVGSSFATMSLMVPLFVPLAWKVLSDQDIPDLTTSHPIFLSTIGAILAGAIFGDHCSPISDTTVLSSAAAGCQHLRHVSTQLPYALMIAACSLLLGYIPIGFGFSCWICLPVSAAVAIGIIFVLGREPEPPSDDNLQ